MGPAALVEQSLGTVLFTKTIIKRTLIFSVGFLDSFLFLVILLGLLVLIHVFDLGLFFLLLALFLLFLSFFILILNLLLALLLDEEVDGVADELGVLLDDLLDALLLNVLGLVFLQGENDAGSSGERIVVAGADGEGSAGG